MLDRVCVIKKWMLLSEKWRNVWLREAGTLGGRARDGGNSGCAEMRAGSIRRFTCLPRWIRPGSGDAHMARDVEALLASAQAAVSAAAAGLPSAARLRVEAARAEALASSGAGAVAKTAAGVGGSLRRQWLRWLAEHGEVYAGFS